MFRFRQLLSVAAMATVMSFLAYGLHAQQPAAWRRTGRRWAGWRRTRRPRPRRTGRPRGRRRPPGPGLESGGPGGAEAQGLPEGEAQGPLRGRDPAPAATARADVPAGPEWSGEPQQQ